MRALGWGVTVYVALALATPCCSGSTSFAAEPAYDSGGTAMAAQIISDADRAAYHGRYTEALADDAKALALSPSYGGAYEARAVHNMDSGRYAEARADLDHVVAMRPDDMWLGMLRAQLALRQRDATAALADLKQALALPLTTYRHQPHEAGTYEAGSGHHYGVTGRMESLADEYASIAYQLLHQDEASLAAMQSMIRIEAEHPEHVLANYCYLAGVVGLLESAELACDQAIEDNGHDVGQYDSEGYVHLRMRQWDKAIADYDKAIQSRPDLTLSVYGRGVARRAKGDVAGGDADIAAATRDEPDIANIMRRLGVTGG